jgi:Tfp pilus assembly protein PilZ
MLASDFSVGASVATKTEIPQTKLRSAHRFPFQTKIEIIARGAGSFLDSVDVSREGLFVRTDRPAPGGQLVQLKVYLTDTISVEMLAYVKNLVVPNKATDEKPAGMGLKIFTMAEADRQLWYEFIADVAFDYEDEYGSLPSTDPVDSIEISDILEPESSADQGPRPGRQSRTPSYHTALEVRPRDMRSLIQFLRRDVSKGGMFIQTDEPLNEGTRVEINIRHPISKEYFTIRGDVARAQVGSKSNDAGVHIRFTSITEPVLRMFHRFTMTGKASD